MKMLTPAHLKKREKDKEIMRQKHQAKLEARFRIQDPQVSQCKCGRYFVNVITGHFKDKKRERCTKCPLKPAFRERVAFSKRLQKEVVYKCKWH